MSIRDDIEEIADLIVAGDTRGAYSRLRDNYRDMPTFDVRARQIAARNKPDVGPIPTEAEIDRRHDEAVARYIESQKGNRRRSAA